MPRPPVPLLLWLACAAPLSAGDVPLTTTPWEVRRDVQELFADLAARRAGGEDTTLIERAQTLVESHGSALIAADEGGAITLAEAVRLKLTAAGLEAAWRAAAEPLAARRLEQARSHDDPAALRNLLRAFAGTAAAATARTRLADRAWDQGQLASFLSLEPGDAAGPRAERRARARELLRSEDAPDPPAALDALEEVWSCKLVPRRPTRRNQGGEPVAAPGEQRPLLAAGGELAALADGLRLAVIDHLVGQVVGREVALGDHQIPLPSRRPAASADGFVALGVQEGQRVVVVAVDRLGRERWRMVDDELGWGPAPSAPVVLDDLVAYAVVAAAEEGARLLVVARHLRDGSPAWRSEVVRIAEPRRFFGEGEGAMSPPALCRHGGGLLALSNHGHVARLAPDGAVQRVWTYPSPPEDMDDGPRPGGRGRRMGSVVSDGENAVATPGDARGLALLIAGSEAAPHLWRGDGAEGEALAVVDGCALLGGRQLALIDLAARKARWAMPLRPSAQEPQAQLGGQAVLFSDRTRLLLIDRATGAMLSAGRGLDKPSGVAALSGLVVVAGAERVAAYGAASGLLDRLRAAAAAAPADHRPHAALANVLAARGDLAGAVAGWQRALSLGAPADLAGRAAAALRPQLDLAVGDRERFPPALALLAGLSGRDPSLAGELEWWRGRDAEARGDRPAAEAAWRACLAQPAQALALRDGLTVGSRALASAGLARLNPVPPRPAVADLPALARAWQADGRRSGSLAVAGGLAITYRDGVLAAVRLADGGEAWWRQPHRPTLGVRAAPGNRQDGIQIDIVPGSSAATAGLRSGDVLVELDGQPVRSFERDLRARVLAMKPRQAFRCAVQREGRRLELAGVLGGEPVEPLAAGDGVLLARATIPFSDRGDLQFFCIELATGRELWSHALPPRQEDAPELAPLLLPDGTVVCADGADLVGRRALAGEGQPAGAERWRLGGRAGLLAHASVLADGRLWLPQPAPDAALVLTADGNEAAAIPDAETALAAGHLLVTQGTDGRPACWDLSLGRLLWRGDSSVRALVATANDCLWVIDGAGRPAQLDLANGKPRRQFAEWDTVLAWSATRDALWLHARRDGRQHLVVLALAGGGQAGSAPVPPGIEVAQLTAGPGGAVVVLRENQGGSTLLHLLPTGEAGATAPVKAGVPPPARALVGGLLVAGDESMTARPASSATVPPSLPCPRLAAAEPPALARTAAQAAAWQACGTAAYAAARSGSSLLLLARIAGEPPLRVHVGDAGPGLDDQGVCAVFAAGRQPSLQAPIGTWRLEWAGSVQDPARPDAQVQALLLAPPAGRPPTAALLLRAQCGEASDGPQGPWWLRRLWRSVAP